MGAQTPNDLHTLFTAAFNAGQVDSIMALYEQDAALVPQPGQITRGRESIKHALQQFLALKGTMQLETAYVIQESGLALMRSQWRLTGKGPDGKPLEMSGKSVEVARRQANGEWLWVIDHPFGAD
jgi:uncharacterized protein (TIGR02246 family)